MPKPHICICLCTFKRPQLLKRTLENLCSQKTDDLFDYSVVVADNDCAQSARATVAEFSQSSPIEIIYAVETKENIALARNKALQQATGDFIAWIDDDEFPEHDWLLNFFNTLERTGADGTLGPVDPVFENSPPPWILKGRFFEKRRNLATGTKLKWYQTSTANAFVRRKILADIAEPFHRQFGSGGEDVDFFKRMGERGHIFVWCNEAVVHEVIAPGRWKRSYLFRRAFLRGINGRHFANTVGVTKSLIALPVYLVVLPFLPLVGQHFFVSFLMKIGDHAGKLFGLAGVNLMGNKYLAENLGNS